MRTASLLGRKGRSAFGGIPRAATVFRASAAILAKGAEPGPTEEWREARRVPFGHSGTTGMVYESVRGDAPERGGAARVRAPPQVAGSAPPGAGPFRAIRSVRATE